MHILNKKYKIVDKYLWGLGIGDWGLGPIPNPQSPIPNPQSPINLIKKAIYFINNKSSIIYINKLLIY